MDRIKAWSGRWLFRPIGLLNIHLRRQIVSRDPCRNSYIKGISRKVRSRIQRFKNLEALSVDTKHKILPKVRHHATQISAREYWVGIARKVIFGAYMISLAPVVFGAPMWARSIFGYDIDLTLWTTITLLGQTGTTPQTYSLPFLFILFPVVLTLSMLLTIMLPIILIPKQIRAFWPACLLLILLFLLFHLVSISAGKPTPIGFLAISVLLGQIAFSTIVYVTVVLLALSRFVFYRAQRSRDPDAIIVDRLIDVLSKVESRPEQWAFVSFRNGILLDLEEVARCIQHDLPRRMRSGDQITDAWFRETTRRIAAAIRAKEMWVLTPKLDTRHYFTESIKETLISTVSANWDDLEKLEPVKTSFRQWWKDWFTGSFRVIFIGCIPLIMLWGIQQSPLALSGVIRDYAIGGTLLWFLFTAITTFDPSFGSKVDALKDIAGLLPFSSKKP
jgi:hypothetical protein